MESGCAVIVLSILLMVFPLGVYAQPLPPAAEPRAPDIAPQRGPAKPLPEIRVDPVRHGAPPGAEKIRIVLQALQIDGATAYSNAELQQIYDDVIGKEITLLQLFEIAERIQTRYREDGFILTRVLVPPQTVKDGVFKIQVIEGFINSIKVDGDVGHVEQRVLDYLDKIRGRQPVNIRDIERYLLLATDLPGITAKGVLRSQPGKKVGASELVVKLARKPFDGYTLANNRGSLYTGPARVSLSIRENAHTKLGESLGLTLLRTLKDDEQEYAQIAYTQPIGSEGLSFGVSGSYGASEPGFDLAAFDVETASTGGTVSLSYPIIRSRSQNLHANGGFEFVNSKTDFSGVELYKDKLRIGYLGLGYDFFDATGAKNSVAAQLRQGLTIFEASDKGDDLSREEGDPQATVIQIDVNRLQHIKGPHSLDLSASGQYAFDTLLSSEEFTLGGTQFGRGYDPAELAGDHGLGLSMEYRHTLAPPNLVETLQAYGFYDFGLVWNKDRDAEPRSSLASIGAGIRARFAYNIFADLEIAKPLTRVPGTEDNKSARLYVQLFARF